MRDYKNYAMAMSPIEEKDLILFNISAEEKTHVVKQYNRALLNSQRDGSDVAQIILKSLISQFPQWGDPALLFGICLAQEGQYKRAMSAFEYAVNNTLRSEQYLLMARDAMKAVKEDIENPPKKEESLARMRGVIERLCRQRPSFMSVTFGAGGGRSAGALLGVSGGSRPIRRRRSPVT